MNDLTSLGTLLAASGGSGGIANSPVFGIKGKKQKRMDPMQILGMLDKFMGGAAKGYQQGQGGAQDAATGQNLKGMAQGGWSPSMGGGQGGMGGMGMSSPQAGMSGGGVGATPPQPSYGGSPQGAQAPGPSGQSPSQLLPLLAQAGMTPQGVSPGQGGVGGMPPQMGGSQMPQGLGGPMGGGMTPMHMHAGINMPGGQGGGGMGGQGGGSLGVLQQLMQQRQQRQGQGGGGGPQPPQGGGQGAAPFPGAEASSAPMRAPGGASPASSGGGGSLKSMIDQAAHQAGIDPHIIYGIVAGESGHGNRYDTNFQGERSYGPFQMNMAGGMGNRLAKQGIDVTNPSSLPAQAKWLANYIGQGGSLEPWRGYHGNRNWNPSWGSMGAGGGRQMASMQQAPQGRMGVGVGGSSGREMGGAPQASGGPGTGAGGSQAQAPGITDPRVENPQLPGSAQEGFYSQAAHRLLQINPNISGKQFLNTMKEAAPFLRLDADTLNKEHKAEMDEIRASQAADKAEMLDRHRQEVEALNAQKAGETAAHHTAQEELSLSEHQRKEMETKIHQDKLAMDEVKLKNTVEKTQATIEIARGHLALANAKSERMSRHMDVTEQQGAQRVQQGEQRLRQGDQRLQQSDVRLQQGRERLDAQKERQQRAEEIKQLDKSIQEAQSQQREIDNLVRSGDVKDAKVLGSSKEFQGQIEDLIAQRKQLVDQAGGSTRAAPPQAAEEPPPVNPRQRVQQQRQGKSAEQGYGGTEGQGGKQPVRVRTPEEASKLPKGTPIILPDGRQGVVP